MQEGLETITSKSKERTSTLDFSSGYAQDAPISHLDHDLLLRIFALNTDMDLEPTGGRWPWEIPALLTLQRTSQVCSFWREILLSSPTLWGRVIDVVVLGRKKDEWGAEVLRRTGQALLSVKADDTGSPLKPLAKQATRMLLDSLLRHHWKRIRSLDVDVRHMQHPTFALLQQPAPFLELFKVLGLILPNYSDNSSDFNPKFQLFAGQAPSLRVFYTAGIPFSLEAPWMAHLRRLHLTHHQRHGFTPYQFTPYQLLRALSHMPFLEVFMGVGERTLARQDGAISLPKVILTRLTYIDVRSRGNMRATLNFLDHITPSPHCCLHFTLGPDQSQPPPERSYTGNDTSAIHAIFSRYSKNYFNSHAIQEASINIGRDTMYVDAAGFYFQLYNVEGFPSFLKSFFSHSNLRSFLMSLNAVEVLHAPAHLMELILDLPEDDLEPTTRLLPSLRNLHLIDIGDYSSVFFSFLQRRREVGLPIQVLDLTRWGEFSVWLASRSLDFSCFEEFVGLRVVWDPNDGGRQKEYTCGSGDPGQLLFSSRENFLILGLDARYGAA